MFRAPLPVACLVQGEVKAGGVGLACACDIVVATEAASFELGEVLFGLIPANVLPYLLALRVPPQKARYLVLSSMRITAAEALRLNLVDELLPSAQAAERRLREIFGRLLRSSPRALSQAKEFTAELIGRTPGQAAALARRRLLRLLRDPEALQGVKAFRDGDLPPWFSRFKPAGPLARWREPEKEDTP
jgi:enoyl-CoA hydratase/carnithine racemase